MALANALRLTKYHAESILTIVCLIKVSPGMYQSVIFPCARSRIAKRLYSPTHEHLFVSDFGLFATHIFNEYREYLMVA